MKPTFLARQALVADSAVVALVGDRIDQSVALQGTALPALVIVGTGDDEGYNLAGPDGIEEGTVSIVCRASDHPGAVNLGEAVLDALKAKRTTVGGRRISFFREPGGATDYADAEKVHRRIVSFRVVAA